MQVSPYRIQDPIPCRLDNPLAEKDPGHWGEKLSGGKIAGNKKILSWLGIHRNRNKIRLCSPVYGDSPEICGEQSNRNHQEEYQ